MDPLMLVSQAVGQARPQIEWAQVSGTQPLPTSFSSPLYVFYPQWHPTAYERITKWAPCHGSALPAAKVDALILTDSAGVKRCVWWDGTTPTAASASGTTTGYTAGTGPALTVDGKTTGGLGTTAYTLGDLVLALKQLGWLKQ